MHGGTSMKRYAILLAALGLLSILITVPGARTSLAAEPPEADPDATVLQPRPLARLFVPRDEFPGILSRRSTPGQLIPVKELKDMLDGAHRRRIEAEAEARRKAREERERFPSDLVVRTLDAKVVVPADRRLARVETTYSIELPNGRRQTFLVPIKGVIAESASLDGKEVLLERRSEEMAISIEGAGMHRLTLSVVTGVGTEGYNHVVSIPVASYPGGSLELEVPGDDLSVRVDPGIDLTTTTVSGNTRATTSLAGGSSIKLTWYTVARHLQGKKEVRPSGSASVPAAPARTDRPEMPRRKPFVTVETCHVAGVSESGLVGLIEFRYSVKRAGLA